MQIYSPQQSPYGKQPIAPNGSPTHTMPRHLARQWAKQILGNNFQSKAQKVLNKLNMQTQITSPKTPKEQCSRINLRRPSQYTVRTLRHNLHPSA